MVFQSTKSTWYITEIEFLRINKTAAINDITKFTGIKENDIKEKLNYFKCLRSFCERSLMLEAIFSIFSDSEPVILLNCILVTLDLISGGIDG